MSVDISFYDRKISEALRSRFAHNDEQISFNGNVDSFQERLSSQLDQRMLVATCNSTAALHLSLCALDLKRGDKIITCVNSFVDVPEVVRHFDAEPFFVDQDARTYNIDTQKLEEVIKKNKTKKLKAIIVNHMAGLAADMDKIIEIANRYNLIVIEDATDAVGATYKGKLIGTLKSQMTVLGLGNKIDNTFDVGVLIFGDNSYFDRAKLVMDHAVVRSKGSIGYLYDVYDIGCQYRMSEYEAIFADVLLSQLQESIERKKEIAKIYFDKLKDLDHLTLPIKHDEHIYTHFIVEIKKNRDSFARDLKSYGIEVGLHYMPLHLTKYYKEKYNLKVFDFPVALQMYQKVMSLPNHMGLSNDDIEYVCEKIIEVDQKHV